MFDKAQMPEVVKYLYPKTDKKWIERQTQNEHMMNMMQVAMMENFEKQETNEK